MKPLKKGKNVNATINKEKFVLEEIFLKDLTKEDKRPRPHNQRPVFKLFLAEKSKRSTKSNLAKELSRLCSLMLRPGSRR